MILTLTMSRSLTVVPNCQKDYFQKRGTQFATRMPSMSTFTFLTFTRPLAIPSDVSAAILKHSFAFVSHFIAEEGYSIFTETFLQKRFQSVTTILFLIIMPDYNYSIFETKQIEPYHLIGIFRCHWVGVWLYIMPKRNMVA